MKCFLLSDNVDTQIGMRLAGIEGVIVYKPDEIIEALNTAVKDPDIAVIFVTKKLMDTCRAEISEMKLTINKPLIVEIPDRHGDARISETLASYVGEAIGLKI